MDTFNKRIRNAQIEQWNFILVVGAKEQENGTVAVRTRDTQQHGVLDFKYVMEELLRLHKDKVLNAETDFKVRIFTAIETVVYHNRVMSTLNKFRARRKKKKRK